ncbi:unnamed protein product [Dovyalis caffra]|uniref:Sacsin/Nov domain-containing protein n=1 Tax=Dovyalis caffra TaxID=77055 RepID=A0AAV1R4U2_9ROSI|nr:unnamed protein product [Dovyalis caffra]
MGTPKEHIGQIRKTTFSIGGENNPLAPMLDQAVKYFAAELYAKDFHFLMELIQNAEDNEYLEGVDPSLEFVIASRDITNTGAPATLLMFNNEKGFSAKNIESICSVGDSTKKGNRKRGYIGEKGIGFKSVFLIAAQPYIFSNGYQIRFNDKPCPHCNLGYIGHIYYRAGPAWRGESLVELGEDYLDPGYFAGTSTVGKQLLEFLQASDIPHICPPNAGIPTASTPLTKQNAFLLLDWIRELKRSGSIPSKFMTCIKEGSWLKITMNGSPGYKPPSQSFLLTSPNRSSNWGYILQNGSVLVDIPLIGQSFYGYKIYAYREELKTVGVMFEYGEACEFIGNHLMSLSASSTLTKSSVISILNFIKFLRQNFLPTEKFILKVKEGRWLRTCRGDRSPVGSVLYGQEWTTARQISDIPFIDQDYYGEDFGSPHKFPLDLKKCIREEKWLRTRLGDYRSLSNCILFGPEWVSIYPITCLPFIDDSDKYYGSGINEYQKELKKMGIVVEFKAGVKFVAAGLCFPQNPCDIAPVNVLSFLECIRALLQQKDYSFPETFWKNIDRRWLKTHAGFRSPGNCCLFNSQWSSYLKPTDGPFIDDDFYGSNIKLYAKELIAIGVDEGKACSLLASHLDSHSEFDTIVRVYD